MSGVNQIFLLIIFQGFYLGSVGQRWTVPKEVTALIGSCVEIPCTYDLYRTSRPPSTVWYLYRVFLNDPEIRNTVDSSSVLEKYRYRTSLVPGEKSCTLRIDPVRDEDGGKYYSGIAGDKSINAYNKYSQTVSLSVTDSPGNIDISETESGEVIIIQCSANQTCRSSPPTIQWNKPGRVTQKSVENNGGSWREESTLTFTPSHEDDGSPVQCTVTYPGEIQKKSRKLSIYYSPKNVTVTIIGKDEVMEGSDVTLQCNSVSKPKSSKYEWYKGEEKTRLKDREKKEIIVRNVTWNMEPYSCTAINTVGRGESALMDIPVLYSPKNVTVTVIGGNEVIEGSDVTLQCNSVSNPDVYMYEWYKGKNRTKSTHTGGKIIIKNVTRDMEPYSCTAINTVGRGESALMDITVLYAAIGVHITVKDEHEFIELSCDFLSSRPDVSHYTWMKDGSILYNETGKTLTLHNDDTYGQYSCIAHNRAGDSSSEEIDIKGNAVNLPLVLVTVAAVFFLLLFTLLIYIFCLRKICKPHCMGSPKPKTAARNLPNNTMEKDEAIIEENQYGNIQSDHNTQPDSEGSMSSVDVNVKENYAIYSNSDVLQPKNEVEYCVISHVPSNQITPARASHEHNVDYATLRH